MDVHSCSNLLWFFFSFKLKKGKKEQLKHLLFLIYNEEGRDILKGKFNMSGLRGEKEQKLGSYSFFLLQNIKHIVQGEYQVMRKHKIKSCGVGMRKGIVVPFH